MRGSARRAPEPVTALLRIATPVTLALAQAVAAQGQIGIEALPGHRVEPPPALLGVWGTAAQCTAGEPRSPYRIGRDWIEQGGIYCLVAWQANYPRAGGAETHVFAQCGEDTLREYRMILLLNGETLRIRWSDTFTTPMLSRCP